MTDDSRNFSLDRARDGAAFILDAPTTNPAIWGSGDRIIWIEGEPFLIVGPQGVGKSTTAQQLTLSLIGIGPTELWGFPIVTEPERYRVLYLAMDRPRQIMRSFQRMVEEKDRDRLGEGLVVWPGPLPFSVVAHPAWLADMADELLANVVIVDSLKDMAPDLTSDPVAIALNSAAQEIVARGSQFLALHHNRKAQGNNKKPNKLEDVYGSTWLTAGAGSVVGLWGSAGASRIEVSHLKQPAESIGTLNVEHERTTGTSEPTNDDGKLIAALVEAGGSGLTLDEAAGLIYAEANDASRKRARRRLDKLVSDGLARHEPGASGGTSAGGRGGGTPGRWFAKVGEG